MSNIYKYLILLIFLSIIGWAYFYFSSPLNQTLSSADMAPEKNSAVTPTAAPSVKNVYLDKAASSGLTKPADIPELKKTLAEEIVVGLEFQSALDLKAFYQKYRQHSSPGIKYWVASALESCLRFAKNPAGKPYESTDDFLQSSIEGKQLAERSEAFNRMRNRCNGLDAMPVKETLSEMNALKSAAEKGGDAKALAARGMLIDNKYSDIEIAQGVAGILKADDPYALVDLADVLQRPGLDYILLGANNHPVSYELVEAAATLASCELGADCTRASVSWANLCIDDGRCDSTSVARQVLDHLDSDADRAEAQRVRDLIVKAAKTGDVSLLGLPK